jgi:ribosome-associated protein
MQPAIRQYYRLEEIWGEKPVKLGAAKRKSSAEGLDAAAAPKTRSKHLAANQEQPEVKPVNERKPAAKRAAATTTAAKKPAAKKPAAKKVPTGATVRVAVPKAAAADAAAAKAAKTAATKRATKAAAAPAAAAEGAGAAAPAAKKVIRRVKKSDE